MKTYKKVFACTLAAGIVLCAAGFAMANFDVRGLDKGGRYETRQYSVSEPVSSVRILAQNAGIRVEKSEGGIQIEYSENKLYRYEVSLEGGVLSLSAIPTKWYQNLINFSSVSVPPVTLRLDETAYEEIFLKTDNGDISSALSLSAETLSVSTDSGDIDFAGRTFPATRNFPPTTEISVFPTFPARGSSRRNRTTAISGRRMFPPRRQYSARRWEIAVPRPWTWPFPPAFPPSSGISAALFAAPFPTIPSAQAPNSETAI